MSSQPDSAFSAGAFADATPTDRQEFTYSVVGVQKAGTSTLQWLLNQHPQVCRPPRKEMGWFDVDEQTWQGVDHASYAVPRRSPVHRAMGDATPRYLLMPRALERMREHRPGMRLIAVFRDPIDRLVSQWVMVRARQPDRAPDWPEMIAWRPADFPREIPEEMRGRGERARFLRASGVVRGYYGGQVQHGLEVFPREQWLFLDFATLIADHGTVLDTVTDHIGVDRFGTHPPLKKLMAGTDTITGTRPTAEDLLSLARTFEPELAGFGRLTGLDVAQWTTSRLLAGSLDPAEQAERYAAKAGLA
ncbi:sulfotransferase domain-containing protein [Nocardioides gansuensis]|uniref:sulfotransferase domain-containing protein n=1 Tax=Nocardioides gansuensis TaxID=2138300 RepID=UPI001403F4F1|nr:sulfotransferase domain-containing protein [Nocardioides gansuensis]